MSVREFLLPDLGEGLTESDLVSWRIAEGDTVLLNQVIAELETAKALVELPSPVAGTVAHLHASEGETVGVGEPLVTFEIPDAEGAVAAEAPAPPLPAAEAGEGARAGAGAGAGAAEAPEAATAHVPSEDSPEPNLVGYGARPERAGRPARRPRRAVENSAAAAPTDLASTSGERPRSTPPVRRLAQSRGIDLGSIRGTGPGGLVTRDDVEAAGLAAVGSTNQGESVESVVVNRFTSAGRPDLLDSRRATAPEEAGDSRIPISGVRKRTAEAMVASAFTAPQASVWLTVDATDTLDRLEQWSGTPGGSGASRETRVTLLSVIAREVCLLLPRHPELNSFWDEPAQEIVRHGRVGLGIAVATPRGLLVPNIPDAGALDLVGLAAAIRELAETARAGRTSPASLRGGTFTITNVGVFGVEGGTPILNPGEAAILAVGAVQSRPWEHEGEIRLRKVLTLSLTFDHRMVDGEQGARFLAGLAALLHDPAGLLPLVGGVRP